MIENVIIMVIIRKTTHNDNDENNTNYNSLNTTDTCTQTCRCAGVDPRHEKIQKFMQTIHATCMQTVLPT